MWWGAARLFCFWWALLPAVLREAPQYPNTAFPEVELVVLGTVQDGGSPHIGCSRSCCAGLFKTPDPSRKVVSLGLIDRAGGHTYLLDAGPDFPGQLQLLQQLAGSGQPAPSGIFLTHAHIGHYSGLMYLGREALNADSVPVFAMPRMLRFLRENGPWSQLSALGNIALQPLGDLAAVCLTPRLEVVPFSVPHRDELSETVGFEIRGPRKTVLYIPDIDKWSQWQTDIADQVKRADLVFLDATFFSGAEVGYRDMSEIPHPFVAESMSLFDNLPEAERAKIHFIHLNHTNPLLDPGSDASRLVLAKGYAVARFADRFPL